MALFTFKIGKLTCTIDVINVFYCYFLYPCKQDSDWISPFTSLSLSTRVINAGKSMLNEDQARCEVLVIKRKPGGNPTSSQIPMTRRRSSLPNGEGFDLPGCLVSEPILHLSRVAASHVWSIFVMWCMWRVAWKKKTCDSCTGYENISPQGSSETNLKPSSELLCKWSDDVMFCTYSCCDWR